MAKKLSKSNGNNKSFHKDLFLFGVLVAIVFAFFKMHQYFTVFRDSGSWPMVVPALAVEKYVILLLLIIGLVIGFLNINRKESMMLLVSALVLFLFKYADFEVLVWNWFNFTIYLDIILRQISLLVGSAAVVVAIKEFIAVAKD